MPRSSPGSVAALLLGLALAAPARAQSLDSLVVRLAQMSAVTGMEDAMADTLRALLPGAATDRAGNVVLVHGNGLPVRVIACPLDERGYVVGGITPDGYLSLRRVDTSAVGPLHNQWLEGQRVTVFGRRGAVPGVVGVRSTHLTRGRSAGADEPFNLDNAWVDVGARTAAEVATLGIAVLAPVTRAKRVHRYGPAGSLLAGVSIAQRAVCAALVSAVRRTTTSGGSTIVAFVRRQHFANAGMGFLLNSYPAAAEAVLLGGIGSDTLGTEPGIVTDSVSAGTWMRHVTRWTIAARYAGTPAETVARMDVEGLERRIADWLGGVR